METGKGKSIQPKKETKYCHNAHYCMIRPSAEEDDEDIVSTGQS